MNSLQRHHNREHKETCADEVEPAGINDDSVCEENVEEDSLGYDKRFDQSIAWRISRCGEKITDC